MDEGRAQNRDANLWMVSPIRGPIDRQRQTDFKQHTLQYLKYSDPSSNPNDPDKKSSVLAQMFTRELAEIIGA